MRQVLRMNYDFRGVNIWNVPINKEFHDAIL